MPGKRGMHGGDLVLSMTGDAYRERGITKRPLIFYANAPSLPKRFKIRRLVKSQYLTLAGLFMQIEDYERCTQIFPAGVWSGQSRRRTDPWSLMVLLRAADRQHKYDRALYYFDGSIGQSTDPPMTA